MALYLVETGTEIADQTQGQNLIEKVAEGLRGTGAELIEAQFTKSGAKGFFIAQAESADAVKKGFEAAGFSSVNPREVRLVGATLEEVKQASKNANYLVEWDLPEGLSMEAYLTRKREKSPLYAKVPEVKFRRTYVLEDMEKCLCFYEAPDEAAVKRAREVVEAPVDRLHELA